MEKRKYKIYSLLHPITKEVRYIGVTSLGLNSRFSQHKHNSLKKHAQTHVAKWFRYVYNETNLLPHIKLIEECLGNWEEREKFWIKNYDNLTNIREGGVGVIVGRELNSIQRSANAHKKPIVQLSEDWSFIKRWDSVKEATQFIGAKTLSSISKAVCGKAGLVYGYRWLYESDWENKKFPKKSYKPTRNSVYRYTLLGEYIDEFPSVAEATRILNVKHHSSIFEAASREGVSKGFMWSFVKKDYLKPRLVICKLNNDLQVLKKYSSFRDIAKELDEKTVKVQIRFQNSKQNKLYKEKRLIFLYGSYWKIL
jgi:hypothetical protein